MLRTVALRRRILYYYRQALGRLGEYLARYYYWRHWHYLVVKNWRCPIGEIDLIALRNRTLHLVEVKTRLIRTGPYTAISQMTKAKREKLQELSRRYWHASSVDIRRKGIKRIQIDYFGIDIRIIRGFPKITITHYPNMISTKPTEPSNFNEDHYPTIS